MSSEANEDDWQICWMIHVEFFTSVTGPQKCFVCSKVDATAGSTYRSTFATEATRCTGGHSQLEPTSILRSLSRVPNSPQLSLCDTCDYTYILDVVKGNHQCRRNECKRRLQINEAVVKEKVKSNQSALRYIMKAS